MAARDQIKKKKNKTKRKIKEKKIEARYIILHGVHSELELAFGRSRGFFGCAFAFGSRVYPCTVRGMVPSFTNHQLLDMDFI